MPKRVNAALSRVPMAGSDPFESMESRRRRLLPDVHPAPLPLQVSTATERASEVTSFARASPTDARIPNRNDAPVLHSTRRGSRAKAAAAVRESDPEALIQELIVDRHAASGVASAASLLRGWQHLLKICARNPAHNVRQESCAEFAPLRQESCAEFAPGILRRICARNPAQSLRQESCAEFAPGILRRICTRNPARNLRQESCAEFAPGILRTRLRKRPCPRFR